MNTDERRITVKNAVAYGIGDLYGGGSFFIIGSFALYFLTNVMGLSPWLAGLVPGLGKVWDAVSDPIMGYLTDRTRSRHGRRRVYFLIGIIPVVVTFALIWMPVDFGDEFYTFLYYFIAYLFFYTVSTMVMVPYSALCADMTTDFKERNKLSGARMIFSITSTLIGAVAAQPIINAMGDPRKGHMVMGLVFGALYALPWIFVFLGTWELPHTRSESDMNMSIFRNFGSIFRNRTFRYHILMYIFSYATLDILMGWIKYFLIDYLRRPDLVAGALGAIVFTELLSLPFYIWFANRRGHARAYVLGLVFMAAGMIAFWFQSPDSTPAALILNCILVGFGLSAGVVIPWTLLPFVTDVDILITRQKRAGTYSGAMTLIRKLIQGGLVLPLLGLLLNQIGYIIPAQVKGVQTQSVTQAADTLFSLKLLFTAMPVACVIIGILFALKFKLTPRNHAILMKEIDRLEKGGRKDDVDPETRSVCEELTGIEYGKLYV